MKFKFLKLFSHNQGFTLIEVMLSIVIFSILTLGMITFFSQAMNYTQKSENDTLGVYVAQNMLNYMQQQSFSAVKTNYIDDLSDEGQESVKVLTADNCSDTLTNSNDLILSKNCHNMFQAQFNNRSFDISVELKKHSDPDLQDSLIPIRVLVKWSEDNQSDLEGYLTDEKIR